MRCVALSACREAKRATLQNHCRFLSTMTSGGTIIAPMLAITGMTRITIGITAIGPTVSGTRAELDQIRHEKASTNQWRRPF